MSNENTEIPPLTQWWCDKCGEIIESSKDAIVLFDSDRTFMHIVHQVRCDDNSINSCHHLRVYLGLEGMNWLLSDLSVGPVMSEDCVRRECSVKDMDVFVDFFRRVQVPYYEEARRKFRNESIRYYLEGANEASPYTQSSLKKIAKAT